jgi:hypothetical protein
MMLIANVGITHRNISLSFESLIAIIRTMTTILGYTFRSTLLYANFTLFACIISAARVKSCRATRFRAG